MYMYLWAQPHDHSASIPAPLTRQSHTSAALGQSPRLLIETARCGLEITVQTWVEIQIQPPIKTQEFMFKINLARASFHMHSTVFTQLYITRHSGNLLSVCNHVEAWMSTRERSSLQISTIQTSTMTRSTSTGEMAVCVFIGCVCIFVACVLACILCPLAMNIFLQAMCQCFVGVSVLQPFQLVPVLALKYLVVLWSALFRAIAIFL